MAVNGTMNVVRMNHVRWTTAAHYTDLNSTTNISGFACAITAKLAGSHFFVSIQHTGLLHCDGELGLKRNGTQVVSNLTGTDRDYSGDYHDVNTYAGFYLDTGISATAGTSYTYQVTARATGCDRDGWFNRDPSNSTNNGRCSITVMEVSP
tara:strand:- start:1062 stop:1514 length:453 start_codon:yes stop_codon:yes gene_type:complete